MYANTKKQKLEEHLFAVGLLSRDIFDKLNLELENKDKILKLAMYSGFFHDLGKIDSSFQKWVVKKSSKDTNEESFQEEKTKIKFSEIVRHNELSWALISAFELIRQHEHTVPYSVYWHHAKK